MTTFVDDIPGIRDLQFEDQPLLPRRSRLAFTGYVTVTDNPANGSTDINFLGATTAGLTSTYQSNVASITRLDPGPTDLPGAGGTSLALSQLSLLRLSPQQNLTLHGIAVTVQDRVSICNVATNYTVTLPHLSSSATGYKFATPTGTSFVLLPGNIITLIKDVLSGCMRIVL